MSFLTTYLKLRGVEHKEILNAAGEVYLRRFYLHRDDDSGVYLHQILLSDDDRHMHGHPWGFTTCILWGGYLEYTPAGVRAYHQGSIIHHEASDVHRLELLMPTWTLVFRGNRKQT